MPDYHVFISSPGDAAIERRRSETVVSRLNTEFAGFARLRTVRWETEHYKAHDTFQKQIPPAADCDVVVGILKWRLGTELPPAFERTPDGEPYPSGTAYEILTAIDKRRQGGELPDVFVFRYSGGSPLTRLDDPDRANIEREWASLRGFFERWFVTRQGHFIAALNGYRDEDDFERQLETLLRKWVADKIAGGRVVPWPATKGSPFRGLDVFGTRHAPVFFGRGRDIRRAIDLLRDVSANGTRFLLLVGASGTGKSSMARAGLIPRLVTPGVVPEVDLWRVAVMRPGDGANGPFAALAQALLQRDDDVSPEEEGRGAALPEIADGDWKTPSELESLLVHADAGAIRPLVNALARIGEHAMRSEHYGRPLRCDLMLLVDQLDELFAPSVPTEVRERFSTLLAAFVASGRVWLLATLRADLYAAMLTVPALKALKDTGASYDLAPPATAELAEIVREPAKAAALTFACDPVTGEGLDERLLREADRPDMLPLLQLALSRLWEARESDGAGTVLPVAAFDRLGGLKGIIEEAGETALAQLGVSERGRLARLIRQLAELLPNGAGGAGLTARAAPLAQAAPDEAGHALVAALVAARLLTLTAEGGGTFVRLAHQRVLSDWARAAGIVADSADFYRVRDEVEIQRRRWEDGKRRGELLLARGLPLAQARAIVDTYGDELSDEIRAFVRGSRNQANRLQAVAWTSSVVFGLIAVLAAGFAHLAYVATGQARLSQQEAVSRLHESQTSQTRSQTSQVIGLVNQGDAERAILLALESLPNDPDHPDRPYLPSAEHWLRMALRLHEVNRNRLLWQGTLPAPVYLSAISYDGRFIAAANDEGVHVFDRVKGTTNLLDIAELLKDVQPFNLQFNSNSLLVVASGRELLLIDVESGVVQSRFSASVEQQICGWHRENNDISLHQNIKLRGDKVRFRVETWDLSGSDSVSSYDCENNNGPYARTYKELSAQEMDRATILISRDMTISFVALGKTIVKVMAQGGAPRGVKGHEAEPAMIAMPTYDFQQILIGRGDGRLSIVNPRSMEVTTETAPNGKVIIGMDGTADSQLSLTAYKEGLLQVYARGTAEDFEPVTGAAAQEGTNAIPCAMPGAHHSISSADNSSKLDIADGRATLVSLARTMVVDGAAGTPIDAAFSDDGRRAFVLLDASGPTRILKVLGIDAASGQVTTEDAMPLAADFQCARMSPDGRHALIVRNGKLRLIDMKRKLATDLKVNGRKSNAVGIAFDKQGKRFATLHGDGFLILWQTATLESLDNDGRNFLSGAKLTRLAFNDTGDRLIIDADGKSFGWRIYPDTRSLMAAAKRAVTDCLTLAERERYFLPREPPGWCIDDAKPPYRSAAWKQWLQSKRAGTSMPMPAQ